MSTSRQICELNRQFRDVAMLAEQGYLYLGGVHGLVHPKVRRHSLCLGAGLLEGLPLVARDSALMMLVCRKFPNPLLVLFPRRHPFVRCRTWRTCSSPTW